MNPKYLLLLALLPVVITIYLSDGIQSSENINVQGGEGIVGQGHFTVTVKDSLGQTTAYKQSDNAVVNIGENCVTKMIFRHPTNAGTTVCTGATNAAWNYLCLGEDPVIAYTDVDIRDPMDSAGLSTCQQATITWNQNSTSSTSALSKVTLRLSSTFTNSGAAETAYNVGIFNETATATRSMLSVANFTGTLVNGGSTITVNYDYESGGGTVP